MHMINELHPCKLALVIVFLSALTIPVDGCGLIVINPDYSSEELLKNPGFSWERDSSVSFDIYYESNSWAAHNILAIKRNADSALERILILLHEPSYPHRLNYFFVKNRTEMGRLINQETNGRAFPGGQILCAIVNDSARALGSHEMFHVIAINVWGSTDDWVNEGMAVYSDNTWWNQDLHKLANYLRDKQKLLTLNELTNRFQRNDQVITYPEAGSFLKYLYETFGEENIEILWKQGLGAFCQSVHKTTFELEHYWLAAIGRFDTTNIKYEIP